MSASLVCLHALRSFCLWRVKRESQVVCVLIALRALTLSNTGFLELHKHEGEGWGAGGLAPAS